VISGFVDLHCHYVPGVDDGVRTDADGVRLCQELARIGYARVVATPHMRSGMFDNVREDLIARFEQFAQSSRGAEGMPELGLGAEHYCDDVFFERFERGEVLRYPGGHALLVELPAERLPVRFEDRLFRMSVKGARAVLAHPERCAALFGSTAPIERAVEMGALPLLDLMALTGKYGRAPKKAAERMLDEGVYFAACSDSHKPEDVPQVAEAIATLIRREGEERAHELLSLNPRRILAGDLE
jgi:protein-tyrosine phosphatase